jgi:hypothetical protein
LTAAACSTQPKDVADPVVTATGISMQIPAGIKPNSPVFHSAQQACHNLIPEGPP